MPQARAANNDDSRYPDIVRNYLDVLETISISMDAMLYVYDLRNDANWFFGDAVRNYTLRNCGKEFNTLAEVLENIYPPDRDAVKADMQRVAAGEKAVHDMEYRWMNRDGQPVWVSSRGNVINGDDGKSSYMVGRVSEMAMRHLHNPLTGLPNKIKMMADLHDNFTKYKGYLVLVDVDDLSAINLSRGRAYGDKVLKNLGYLLEDTPLVTRVYHVDNNNFAVFVDTDSEEKVRELIEYVQDQTADKYTITCAVVPMDSSVFIDENNMYDSVKITLRKAKTYGKSVISFFSQEEITQRISAIKLLEEMSESVKNGFDGFCLNYQPQVNAGSYELFSTEVLLRYTSPSRGRVFPDEFIPLLEQSRLINNVGLWVLEMALLQCKKWRQSIPELRVSVNFSTVQFESHDIVEDVLSTLEKTGMPGDALTIEITESVHLHDIQYIAAIIEIFKSVGIQIAVDDFGTGYSNIAYLKELDVDEIKIDRMFVQDIREDTYNYKLIGNTVEFAKMNGLRVCCEGVEEQRELMILEGLSPDLMQGYFFDKPCLPHAIEDKYFNTASKQYAKRCDFVEELYRHKEKLGVVHFDPRDILRETNVGLWVIRVNEAEQHFELHADETMERIMAVDKKYTPAECYQFWYSRVKPECLDYVQRNVAHMTQSGNIVQLEYEWLHPDFGEVVVRCTGRRTNDCDGMIVLEGYHRILSNIEEM